ncbi:MAG: CBS domain-containing protein [Bacteroidetes bacterium]|nr:MAG: CBS domain-containing protein [Bacteroidota bacterium]
MKMVSNPPLSRFLSGRNVVVSSQTRRDALAGLFEQYPELPFLPVEKAGRFAGVIFREAFFAQKSPFDDLEKWIDPNIVYLYANNTLSEAMEVFATRAFKAIPVVDCRHRVAGILIPSDLPGLMPRVVRSKYWRGSF